MKIGIVDFNFDNSSVVAASLNSLAKLIPDCVEYSFLNFKNNFSLDEFDSLILTGSALSAYSFQEMLKKNIFEYENYFHVHKTFKKLLDYKNPVIGICFGAQILALVKGGEIGRLDQTEFGYLEHTLTEDGKTDPVFGELSEIFFGAHSHNDYVLELPRSTEVKSSSIIATHNNYIHAFKIVCENDAVCYGVQPHPEMSTSGNATFMFTENKNEIKNKIGEDEYKRIVAVPENVTFELPEVISKFIESLQQYADRAVARYFIVGGVRLNSVIKYLQENAVLTRLSDNNKKNHYHPIDFKITIKTSINTMLYIRFSGKQYLTFRF